jgi:hypothetical protein
MFFPPMVPEELSAKMLTLEGTATRDVLAVSCFSGVRTRIPGRTNSYRNRRRE